MYKKYENTELKENEYLLKIRPASTFYNGDKYPVGYLTKLTQKQEIPKNFLSWERDEEIYLYEESFKSGWEFVGHRIGKSQQWTRLKHPEGFILEIYLDSWKKIILSIDIKKGKLIGEFMWQNNHLIKK